MNKYNYKDYKIEVYSTSSYASNSEGSDAKFDKFYFGAEGEEYPSSQYGVRVYYDDDEVNSCTIIASGGATEVHEQTTLLDGEELLACCGDTVFCLIAPELELKWSIKADEATCFEIFKYEQDYIIWGELEITRIDKGGNIKWQFTGKDIFVSPDDDAFKIENNNIMVKDWENTVYVIDTTNGNSIN